jgi:ABC-2 type transport system ATP-binding protein
MSFPIYIATELTKKFGNKMVIDKLSFEIYENEFVYRLLNKNYYQ